MRGVGWFNGLLPSGSAYKLQAGSNIRKFFSGLGSAADDIEEEAGNVFFDIFPETTRCLDDWDEQFAISGPTATEQDQRDRLLSAWRETGGQSPGYIQNVLQEAGFDVYVHESAEFFTSQTAQVGQMGKICSETACKLGSLGVVGGGWSVGAVFDKIRTIRDPRPFIGGYLDSVFGLDDFGNPINVGGVNVGRRGGFLLVNSLIDTVPSELDDPDTWPYVWYIGAEIFGDFADVSNERKDEFISKIQKIRPRHTWIVLFTNFG